MAIPHTGLNLASRFRKCCRIIKYFELFAVTVRRPPLLEPTHSHHTLHGFILKSLESGWGGGEYLLCCVLNCGFKRDNMISTWLGRFINYNLILKLTINKGCFSRVQTTLYNSTVMSLLKNNMFRKQLVSKIWEREKTVVSHSFNHDSKYYERRRLKCYRRSILNKVKGLYMYVSFTSTVFS